MKYILILSLISPLFSFSQYSSFTPFGLSGGNYSFAAGTKLAFGYYKDGTAIGVGGGFILFPAQRDDLIPHFPIFVDITYVGKKKKPSPYINANLGYAIGELRHGLYTSFNGGLALPVGTKMNKVYFFVGAMPLVLKQKKIRDAPNQGGTFFNFGIGILTAK